VQATTLIDLRLPSDVVNYNTTSHASFFLFSLPSVAGTERCVLRQSIFTSGVCRVTNPGAAFPGCGKNSVLYQGTTFSRAVND
jgi:hypothetical protein